MVNKWVSRERGHEGMETNKTVKKIKVGYLKLSNKSRFSC